MTEPTAQRPVPGPPSPGSAQKAPAADQTGTAPVGTAPAPGAGDPFADLADRPVAEHVGIFEAEHARLQRELGTIDQL